MRAAEQSLKEVLCASELWRDYGASGGWEASATHVRHAGEAFNGTRGVELASEGVKMRSTGKSTYGSRAKKDRVECSRSEGQAATRPSVDLRQEALKAGAVTTTARARAARLRPAQLTALGSRVRRQHAAASMGDYTNRHSGCWSKTPRDVGLCPRFDAGASCCRRAS